MDQNGSSPSYKDIAAQFAEARAAKVKSDATSRSSSKRAGATSTNKVEEVRFKTSHGLLVVFLTWILFVRARCSHLELLKLTLFTPIALYTY